MRMYSKRQTVGTGPRGLSSANRCDFVHYGTIPGIQYQACSTINHKMKLMICSTKTAVENNVLLPRHLSVLNATFILLLLQVSIASARAESESCTVAYAVPET